MPSVDLTKRLPLYATIGLVIAGVMFSARVCDFGVPVRFVLDPNEARVVGHLNDFRIPTGLLFSPRVGLMSKRPVSSLRVLENGLPLGPANSNPTTIEQSGSGRYLHHGGLRTQRLFFSTSDNTSAQTNGREYAIEFVEVPTQILIGLVGLISFLLAATSVVFDRGQRRRWLAPRPMLDGSTARRGRYLRLASIVTLVLVTLPLLTMWVTEFGFQIRAPLYWGQMGVSESVAEVRTKSGLWVEGHADTMDRPYRSDLVLTENGIPLGPAHATVDELRRLGGGRYFHWGSHPQILYFTSSDGTSPAHNERRYEITYSVFPTAFLCIFGAMLPILFWVIATAVETPSWSDVRKQMRRVATNGGRIGAVLVIALFVVALVRPTESSANLLTDLRALVQSVLSFGMAIATAWFVTMQWRRSRGLTFAAAFLVVIAFQFSLLAVETPSYVLGIAIASVIGIVVPPAVRTGCVGLVKEIFGHRALLMLSALLALVVVAPEVIRYWNLSGWMDSYTYDRIAWRIALGEMPAGHSYYMPIYQYGMALIYWIFGHDWRPQQLVNVALAVTTVLLMFDLALRFTRSLYVAFATAVLVMLNPAFHHAVWYTQIENWLIPSIALSLWCLVRYLEEPSGGRLLLLAFAAAVVFNIRLQNAFYAAALGAIVLVPMGTELQRRLRHALMFALAFSVIGVLPWTLRNYEVEGRFTPGSAQSAESMAVTNDARIGFYGLRYSDNYAELAREWRNAFPDDNARYEAQHAFYWQRVRDDPNWFVEAMKWRLLAFYGLAPASIFAADGPKPFDWREELVPYLWRSVDYVPLIIASTVAIVASPWRLYAYLVVLVLSNVVVIAFAGFGEPRLCYPVLLIHALMALTAFAGLGRPVPDVPSALVPSRSRFAVVGVAITLALIASVIHMTYGRHHMFRALEATYVRLDPDVRVDTALPTLDLSVPNRDVDSKSSIGRKVRATFVADSGMFPPRYIGPMVGSPDIVRDRLSPPFFYALVVGAAERPIPVRYQNVVADQKICEGMVVEAELEVVARGSLSSSDLWFKANKVKVVKPIPG